MKAQEAIDKKVDQLWIDHENVIHHKIDAIIQELQQKAPNASKKIGVLAFTALFEERCGITEDSRTRSAEVTLWGIVRASLRIMYEEAWKEQATQKLIDDIEKYMK